MEQIVDRICCKHDVTKLALLSSDFKYRRAVTARYDVIRSLHRVFPFHSPHSLASYLGLSHTTVYRALGRVKGNPSTI